VPGHRWCVLPATATFTPASPLRRRPQDEQRTLQTLNDRLAMQRLRKGDLERKIRDLGSLPDEAFEKFRGLSLKRLQQELSQVGAGGSASSCWGLSSRRLLPRGCQPGQLLPAGVVCACGCPTGPHLSGGPLPPPPARSTRS
jgi:hypothetical protein